MPKSTRKHYSEIDDIREDLDSLRNNVVELTRHLRKDGSKQSAELKSALLGRISNIQEKSRGQYKIMEKGVKAHPSRSVAIAFGAGLLASVLLLSRK